ncbi:MAG: glycosyltransferase family 2 protein [Dehalococcoidia bacterium]|jgi:GT2 family glycosyltransferase
MKYPKVSIIILNWNQLKETIECLDTLKKIIYPNYEVILVDNGSEGHDADILQARYGKELTIIRNNKNYGFTGNNNIGIRYEITNANPDYILLLNNDTMVDPDFLTELIKVAEEAPLVGIVGSKTYLYNDPGRFQAVWYKLDMYRGCGYAIGGGEIDRGQYDSVRSVDAVQGSCFLIKRTVIDRIGLLAESYFMYAEEYEYCIRARKAGYKILYAPMAKIWHKESIRVKPWYKALRRKDQGKISLFIKYIATRNFLWCLKEHGTRWQYFSVLLHLFSYYFWRQCAVCMLYYRSPGLLRAYLVGVKEGLCLKPQCGPVERNTLTIH